MVVAEISAALVLLLATIVPGPEPDRLREVEPRISLRIAVFQARVAIPHIPIFNGRCRAFLMERCRVDSPPRRV